MITIIRDITTRQQDFIFFVDRLATLLVEHALGVLPYRPKSVTTPVGVECQGKELDASVSNGALPGKRSMLTQLDFPSLFVECLFLRRMYHPHVKGSQRRSTYLPRGGALERGFRRVIHDAPLGSLLVQSDTKTGEPLLLHVMLPICIRERHMVQGTWVLLLDAQVRIRSNLSHVLCGEFIFLRSAQVLQHSWLFVFS